LSGDAQRLLIVTSGSAGMVSLPYYLIAIQRAMPDLEVRVLMSESAQRFLPASTIRLFCPTVEAATAGADDYLTLANRATTIVVLPASANVLAEIAHGFGDSATSQVVLLSGRRVVLFPDATKRVWEGAMTRRNVAMLRERGHTVVESIEQNGSGRPSFGYTLPTPAETAAVIWEGVARARRAS